ncbi:MAG TPA: GNAT family N-acetyltransferase [Chitinophagales bacterium]|nr:GNAT family N-acetyltransferase [Chitinophagales bacterium]
MHYSRIANHIFLNRLSHRKLDKLLDRGYFRNANIMFQSQVICLDGYLDDVINIRLELDDYKASKSIRKIARRVESRFSFEIQKVCIDERKEELYQLHQKRFKGFQFKSLKQMLLGDHPVSVFNTYEVNVYDGDTLIAFSLFDIGQKSIASILGVFDESYKKYSLGLYTMHAEIKWAIENDFEFYYPGYIVKNNSLFDYKLRMGDYKYFDWTQHSWRTREEIFQLKTVGDTIKNKLQQLAGALQQINVDYEYKIYPYYSLGYLSMTNYQFYVKSPYHIYLPQLSSEDRRVLLEYDAEENKYVLASTKVNESYMEMIMDSNQQPKESCEHSWNTVLEYLSIHKYPHTERLIRDIWLNS